jgi:phosphoribosylformimino-5-aminoimidazole carboxamide ribotide isomerase
MLVIPAIDINEGQCVKRVIGQERQTVYSDNPRDLASHWVEQGAQLLHLVDLDGAMTGEAANFEIISGIANDHPGIAIQSGGGVRSLEHIERLLDVGVKTVVIGTRAVETPEFIGEACARFAGHIMVGLDGIYDMIAVNGRSKITEVSVKSLAMLFEFDDIEGFVYTDAGRDGTLGGPAFRTIKNMSEGNSKSFIVSGGVASMKDIEDLLELSRLVTGGVTGVIVNRALHEGHLDLREAQAVCDADAG